MSAVINTTSIQPKEERLRKALDNPFTITRELNNRSLYHFLQYFWPLVSSQDFSGNWHVEYLCKELEKIAYRVANKQPKEYDLIINVPPGTTKTITCSIMFPAWCWTKWYWMRFITGSYSATLALESAEYCRDIVRHKMFRDVYPELDIKEDKDVKSNFKIVKKYQRVPGRLPQLLVGGNRFSTSVGGTLMGFHADILIWDDPLNPNSAVSSKELETTNRWIDQVLPTRKTNKKVSTIIGVMQRLHQNDPTGHILAKKKENVKNIALPGEILNFRKQLNPPELAEHYVDNLLDPVRLDWKVLKDIEADLGQYGYAGQIGQDPTPPGGGMFKVDHFITINSLPAEINFIKKVRYWDKAGSEGKGAFTVGTLMIELRQARWLVVDVKRGQWASEEREAIIRETAIADGGDVEVYVEQEPGSGGKESAEGTIRNLAGFSVHKDPVSGDGNKVKRADPYSVQVNNGNVYLLKGDWNYAYIEEHRFFPNGTYKDQVDASSGAFNKLRAKKIAGRVV